MIGLPTKGVANGNGHRMMIEEGGYGDDVEEQMLLNELNGYGNGGGVDGHDGKGFGIHVVRRRTFWSSFLNVQRSTVRLTIAFVIGCILWAVMIALPGAKIRANDGRTLLPRHWTLTKDEWSAHKLARWRVPRNTKVIGLVFFGRRKTASLLSCYLERNLKRNGGVLDEVIWMQGTARVDDVRWMYNLANVTDGFSTFYNEEFAEKQHYPPAYSVVFAEQHKGPVVYVKIDDDIVFMEDIAITSIVHRLLTDPKKPFLVGANVVNQAALSWVHYSIGGVDGYLPELEAPPPTPPADDDKTKAEPYWSGPSDYKVPRDYHPPKPHDNRWLPLRPGEPIDRTPIAKDDKFDPMGSGLMWWPIGAQQHYSLLGKLNRNDVSALKYDVWDFNYVRMGIQFFAIRREDIVEQFPFPIPDDEHHLSVVVPFKLKRRGIVDGRNVVSHYSYGPQYGGMDSTDIFSRYRTFAEQNICYSTDAIRSAIPNITSTTTTDPL